MLELTMTKVSASVNYLKKLKVSVKDTYRVTRQPLDAYSVIAVNCYLHTKQVYILIVLLLSLYIKYALNELNEFNKI